MSVSNPAPVVDSITVTAIVGGFSIEYTKPTDLDFAGLKVYASTSTGFTPSASNLVADSSDSTIAVVGLAEGQTYYYKYIPYDAFGDGTTSSEGSVLTLVNVVSGSIADPASSDRQLAEDEYIMYADVITGLADGKHSIAGSASLTVTNPENWTETEYQQCKVAAFAYETKTLIPVSVDLSSTASMAYCGSVTHKLDGDGEDIAQYVSVGDYVSFKADNGVESKLYEVCEIVDSTTLRVKYVDANLASVAYTIQGEANTTQCRVYTNPTAIVTSVFSTKFWSKEYAANNTEDFDLSGGFQLDDIEIDSASADNILMMLWVPSMGCVPGVSAQGLDKASLNWQATYKGV